MAARTAMNPDRWRRIADLYHLARGRPDAERQSFLADACRDDEALRREVQELLDQHGTTGDLLQVLEPTELAFVGHLDDAPDSHALIGHLVGPYRVQRLIGAGAMGEVYSAHDTKLGRDVALKVLRWAQTADDDRRRRFEHEARVLASLNHPNIAAIHGWEDGSVPALVLELVEGDTLKERLAKGPLSVAATLNFARQIVDALDAAHSRGIVHRDLKPANIKITPDGVAKVLDFGIAKVLSEEVSIGITAVTTPSSGTRRSGVAGTLAYMSPEQARNEPVDKRSDIWAFGCVVYEMLTRRRAFSSGPPSDAAERTKPGEPDFDALPADTPPALRRLIRRCLDPDLKRRFRDIADAWGELDDAMEPRLSSAVQPDTVGRARWLRRAAVIAVLLVLVAVGALTALRNATGVQPSIQQFVLTPPEGVDFGSSARDRTPGFAISPDGRRVAFIATDRATGRRALWVRELGSLHAEPLAGTDGAGAPFWRPDGLALGFFADGKLKKVGLDRTPSVVLASAPTTLASGTWSERGVIVYSAGTRGGLFSISENGGAPRQVTDARRDGHFGHVHPRFLPDGDHFLYLVHADEPRKGIYVASIGAPGSTQILATREKAVYAPPGYLVFPRDGRLRAQRFDADRLAVSGDELAVTESVAFVSVDGRAAFDVSPTGTLLYRVGGILATSQPIWFDRSGHRLGSVGDAGDYQTIGISPDGSRLAAELHDLRTAVGDLWLFDLKRGGSPSRLTFDGMHHNAAVWSPDGERIVFSAVRAGGRNLYLKPIGSDADEPLLPHGAERSPNDWSRNGYILFQEEDPATGFDLWTFDTSTRTADPFLRTEFVERDGRFSPNGRFIAYVSNETGRAEVYVRPFSTKTPKIQVSSNGGRSPRWNPDGSELFFFALDNSMYVVPAQTAGEFTFGQARRLFVADIRSPCGQWSLACPSSETWEVINGEQFLVNLNPPGPNPPAPPITVVFDWQSLLQDESD